MATLGVRRASRFTSPYSTNRSIQHMPSVGPMPGAYEPALRPILMLDDENEMGEWRMR
jgi:hypothetical protein